MPSIGGDGRYVISSAFAAPSYIDVSFGRVVRIVNPPDWWSDGYLNCRLRAVRRAAYRRGCKVMPTRKAKV